MQLLVFFPFHAPIYSFSFFLKGNSFSFSLFNFCDPRSTSTTIVKMASIKMQLEVATRHAGKNKRSSHIFMSAATKREREGTKDSASHKHDSSNLSALPLESYDLVTKKKKLHRALARSTEFKDQIMHSHPRA